MLRVFWQLPDEPLHVTVSCVPNSGGQVCEIRMLLVATGRGWQEVGGCGARNFPVPHLRGRGARWAAERSYFRETALISFVYSAVDDIALPPNSQVSRVVAIELPILIRGQDETRNRDISCNDAGGGCGSYGEGAANAGNDVMTSGGKDSYASAHAVAGNAESLRMDDDFALTEAGTSENLEHCP